MIDDCDSCIVPTSQQVYEYYLTFGPEGIEEDCLQLHMMYEQLRKYDNHECKALGPEILTCSIILIIGITIGSLVNGKKKG